MVNTNRRFKDQIFEDLEARMKDMPKDREIVAYCRGPYCVMAVVRLDMGVVDWQARGIRLEQGAVAGAKRN